MIIATPGQWPIAPIGENDFVSTDSLGLLLPGERIVWSGEPVRHRLLRIDDVFLIPFSLMWGGFVLFFAAGAVFGQVHDPIAMVCAVPLVLLALYLVFGRFVVRSIASRKARYLVTDRRVVVTGGVTGRAVGTEYLAALPPPVITENEDGSGDLAFGAFPNGFGGYNGFGTHRRPGWTLGFESVTPFRFRDIPDVVRVRDLILASQTAARQS